MITSRSSYRARISRGCAFLLLTSGLTTTTAMGAVPPLVNYQGYLTDQSGSPRTETLPMRFAVYANPVGGTALWSETYSAIGVSAGVFNVLLGSVEALPESLFTGATLWLQTAINDTVLQPRRPIVTVAYAFRSNVADDLAPDMFTDWTGYEPTWTADSGPDPDIGTGTLVGEFMRFGRTVFFRVEMNAGSTTTFGAAATSSNWRIGLPLSYSPSRQASIHAYAVDLGTGERLGIGGVIPTGSRWCHVGGESGGFWDSLTPHTWAEGDRFVIQGWYRID